MPDQANDLRRLVMTTAVTPAEPDAEPAPTVLVTSGKGGAGTTTVAVNLATLAAQRGLRTVLIDGDPHGGDVQTLCRLRERYSISDVLSGGRTLGEALQPGPAGLMVLPGTWAAADLADASEINQARVLDQMARLGPHADLVVVDGGNGLHGFTRRLWQACHEVVLVTGPDEASVLDTYAAMKIGIDPRQRPPIHLLVSGGSRPEEAANVHQRMARSCRRFLDFDLTQFHWLADEPALAKAATQGMPLVVSQPASDTAQTLQSILDLLEVGQGPQPGQSAKQPRTGATQVSGKNSEKRLNPRDENADSQEDRSLFALC